MLIDRSMLIRDLLSEGLAVAVFRPVTLLTDDITPLPIAALDVVIVHNSLHQPRHDTKPWKTAVGNANIDIAQTQSIQALTSAIESTLLPAIMAEHTTI